jgi:hypothetical protein
MTWVAAGTATLTAAEIAAAEAAAAAAATAAAEAAAATAASQGAGTALVAEAAPALTQTAATVLPEVAGTVPEATGILEAAPGVTPPPAEPMTPAGLEQIVPAEPMPPAGEPGIQMPVENYQFNPADSIEGPGGYTGQAPAGQELSPDVINAWNQGQADAAVSGSSPYAPTASTGQTPLVQTTPAPTGGEAGWSEGFSPADSTGPVDAPTQIPPPSNVPTPETNPFLQGVKDVGNWMDANPFKTGAAAYLGLQYTGAFRPNSASMPAPEKKKFANQYSLSPNFKGGPYSEPNVYKPSYASGGITQINPGPVQQMSQNTMGGQGNMFPQSQQEHTNFATPTQMPASAEVIRADYDTKTNPYSGVMMAGGGVARFTEGEEVEERPRRYQGNLMGTLDRYNEMIEGRKSGSLPSGKSDPYTGETGIFRDDDVDTRLQDAYTASLTRLKKGNKRANVDVAGLPAGIQAGALNMPTKQAAGGGIMQASLGGYAAGGNPRLLRGPGDGMSDNIPATIGGKQPARLADGEFVVPADVVSHLGNGSTDAGAKKLHGMMDKVRMDRTGKKKQAPAVKPNKYIPK